MDELTIIEGSVPNLAEPPQGCRFHPRCSYATDICMKDDPQFRDLEQNGIKHWVACHHAENFV